MFLVVQSIQEEVDGAEEASKKPGKGVTAFCKLPVTTLSDALFFNPNHSDDREYIARRTI